MAGAALRKFTFWSRFALLVALPSAGCQGVVSSPAPAATPGTGQPNEPGQPPAGGTTPGAAPGSGGAGGGGIITANPPPSAPGVAPLRRLSLAEYRNTVRDLLGADAVKTDDLPVDQLASGSGYSSGASITSAPDARLLLDKSDALATAAMTGLATATPCLTIATSAEPCARQFISQFGRRAFRRPLIDDEVTPLVALYDAQRAADVGATFSEAIRGLVVAMLQSPNFLYRRELGSASATMDGALVRYNSQEMASQLSYAFWASMPDDRLFQAADAGKLQTPAEIQQEARRMLIDTKAKDGYADFAIQWLSMTQLPTTLKDASLKFTPQVAQSMLAETGAFVSNIFLGPNATGSLEELLTSPTSFVDPTLAKIYGLPAMTGTAMQPVTFNATQRAGILTQASFLTMHGDTGGSFPVRRGAQVFRQLFCREVELPDDLEVVAPPPAKPGQTTRQRFAEHAMNPCAGCHALFEPIGFAFENYDGVGAYRTTDNGQSVDASGSIPVATGQLTFNNAIDLANGLAKNDQVRDCVATQWTRYMLRRKEGAGDMASLQQAQKAFRASSFDMRELLVAIASGDSFLRRTPAAGEVLR